VPRNIEERLTAVLQLYRTQRDSSAFTEPRVFARIFPEPEQFEQTVHDYEKLTGATLDMYLDARDLGIQIAAVGAFLIVAVDPGQPERLELVRNTAVSMVFPELDSAIEAGRAIGAEVVTEPFATPVGRGARLRHPDGVIVEYLEHRPGPYDTDVLSL
jgi:hypothetical protein